MELSEVILLDLFCPQLKSVAKNTVVNIILSPFIMLLKFVVSRHTLAGNVWRIDVGGLSKLPVSTRTNVYLKIQMFLFPRPPAYVYLLLPPVFYSIKIGVSRLSL